MRPEKEFPKGQRGAFRHDNWPMRPGKQQPPKVTDEDRREDGSWMSATIGNREAGRGHKPMEDDSNGITHPPEE